MKPKYRIEHIDNKYRVSKRFLWFFYAFEIDPETGWPYEFETFRQAQEYVNISTYSKIFGVLFKNVKKYNFSPCKGSYIPPENAIPLPPKRHVLPETPESLKNYLKNRNK